MTMTAQPTRKMPAAWSLFCGCGSMACQTAWAAPRPGRTVRECSAAHCGAPPVVAATLVPWYADAPRGRVRCGFFRGKAGQSRSASAGSACRPRDGLLLTPPVLRAAPCCNSPERGSGGHKPELRTRVLLMDAPSAGARPRGCAGRCGRTERPYGAAAVHTTLFFLALAASVATSWAQQSFPSCASSGCANGGVCRVRAPAQLSRTTHRSACTGSLPSPVALSLDFAAADAARQH